MITVLDRAAKCPFYSIDRERAIVCEGFDDETQHAIALHYRAYEDKRDWGRTYCIQNWRACPIAAALLALKYNEGIEEDSDED